MGTGFGPPGIKWRGVFPPVPTIYRTMRWGRQGRASGGKRNYRPMLNDVYNKRIIELAGNIPRLGRLPSPDATATAHSKLCGSTVKIDPQKGGGGGTPLPPHPQ